MEFDLLSSIFMRMRLKASIQNVFDAGGRWAIEVPVHRGIKIHTILKGRCWISLADDPTPRELVEGDCYLLPRGNAFLMSSDPTGSVAEIAPAMVLRRNEGITQLNGGGDFLGNGLFFDFASPFADILFQSLPSLITRSWWTSTCTHSRPKASRRLMWSTPSTRRTLSSPPEP